MILTLEITGPREGMPPGDNRKVFRAAGGTIGRLMDNDLVLPDPYVSSRHARIHYANGAFQIEDTSTNGVFVNSQDNRLQRGQPYALQSGDRVFIEPYEMRATVTPEADHLDESAGFSDPFGPPTAPPRFEKPSYVGGLEPEPDPMSSSMVDPLKALGFDVRSSPSPRAPRASDLANGGLMSEHYQPPSPVGQEPSSSEPEGIPADWLDSRISVPTVPPPKPAPVQRQKEAPRPAPVAPPPSQPRPAAGKVAAPPPVEEAAGGSLEAVLIGAGIDSSVLTPEVAQSFGRIIRVVVAGLIDVLQARQRLKDEFRMRMTTFKPAQNNPLKFSVDVDDALYNLLVKRNAAFLGPVEAFEDAFDDIRNHQMAMLAGVRVAFETMLAEFNPDRLQEEFDRHGKSSLLSVPGKLRYWDQYRSKFSDMVSDADASFRELFGHEFARAYEEQLERLKAGDKPRNP